MRSQEGRAQDKRQGEVKYSAQIPGVLQRIVEYVRGNKLAEVSPEDRSKSGIMKRCLV